MRLGVALFALIISGTNVEADSIVTSAVSGAIDLCRGALGHAGQVAKNFIPMSAPLSKQERYERAQERWSRKTERDLNGRAKITSLDRMVFIPQILGYPGPTRFVNIVIHGIGEGPGGIKPLSELGAHAGMNSITVLLPGHGGNPEDLDAATRQQWRDEIDELIDIAKDMGDEVIVSGFSLGGLLAVDAKIRHPNTVKAAVTYGTPFRVEPDRRQFFEIQYGRYKLWREEGSPAAKKDQVFWMRPYKEPAESPIKDYGYSRTSIAGYMQAVKLQDEIFDYLRKHGPIDGLIMVHEAENDPMIDHEATQEFMRLAGIDPKSPQYYLSDPAKHEWLARPIIDEPSARGIDTETAIPLMDRMKWMQEKLNSQSAAPH